VSLLDKPKAASETLVSDPPGRCRRGNEKKWKGTIVKRLLVLFAHNKSGATAIEYGLLAASISLALISAVKGVGTKLNSTFASVSTALR